MSQTKTKDHAALAGAFIKDEERVDWHDGALWYIREKRDIASKQIPEWEDLREAASRSKAMSFQICMNIFCSLKPILKRMVL